MFAEMPLDNLDNLNGRQIRGPRRLLWLRLQAAVTAERNDLMFRHG
jgi:hypothetical protein